jgi:hypothetical protein
MVQRVSPSSAGTSDVPRRFVKGLAIAEKHVIGQQHHGGNQIIDRSDGLLMSL